MQSRRNFFKSLIPSIAALPAVAIRPVPALKPPVTAHPICGACHGDMMWDRYPQPKNESDIDWQSQQTVHCVRPYCPQYNISVKVFSDQL